jgi:hypothetical protein
MSRNDGGSAFPEVSYKEPIGGGSHIMVIEGGMTLRDYFAAKAMQGIIWDRENLLAVTHLHKDKEPGEAVASAAYSVADAMLKARDA